MWSCSPGICTYPQHCFWSVIFKRGALPQPGKKVSQTLLTAVAGDGCCIIGTATVWNLYSRVLDYYRISNNPYTLLICTTLYHCVFRLHYCVWSTVTQNFRYGWGSYSLCKLMNTWDVYTACMSPTLNGGSALQPFKRSNAIEIHKGIMFNFYLGLPHV